mmetsp:Transcript_51635/g.159119  ORF Transcript_51635/g.159119 Transcript_51635/m.159119 type:complete len:258 (-) Transcript_51635:999-1772(-)
MCLPAPVAMRLGTGPRICIIMARCSTSISRSTRVLRFGSMRKSPVSSSYAMQPSDHTSVRQLKSAPKSTSGARYSRVWMSIPRSLRRWPGFGTLSSLRATTCCAMGSVVVLGSRRSERPKSASVATGARASPSSSARSCSGSARTPRERQKPCAWRATLASGAETRTFSGFRSVCRILADSRCASDLSTATVISLTSCSSFSVRRRRPLALNCSMTQSMLEPSSGIVMHRWSPWRPRASKQSMRPATGAERSRRLRM